MKTKQNRAILVLGKSRSYRASFREAANLIVSNLKTLFLSLYPFPVVMGLTGALLSEFSNVDIPVYLVGLVIFAFLVVSMREAFSCMMKDFQQTQKLKKIVWKTDWKGILIRSLVPFYLLVAQLAICVALTVGAVVCVNYHPGWFWGVVAIVVVLALVLCVPFNITLNYAQLSNFGFVKAAVRGFVAMRRHYGPTLMLLFMSLLIVGGMCMVCYLPILVLNMAMSASEVAVSFGDATDLPSSLYVVRFLLCIILFSLMGFLLLLWFVPQYLHHYSMEKKEDDRKKELEKMQMTREAYLQAKENYYLTMPQR